MTEMVERAAKAHAYEMICDGLDPSEVSEERAASDVSVRYLLRRVAETAELTKPAMRAALLAALDPEDEALVERVAVELWLEGFPSGDNTELRVVWRRYMTWEPSQRDLSVNRALTKARTAISTLRATAQGGNG